MPEAATIEAPETKPTPAAHPGAVTIDLANLGKKPAPKTDVQVTPPTDAEKAAADAKAAETAAAAAAEAAKQQKPNDKEHNLAELRKAREAAETARKALEEEHNRLKAEFEALKTKTPELSEDVKTRLTKAEQLEKEREELQRTIRQLDLSKDPEFQAKYNQPITDRIGVMGQTALAAGISEADWKAAVSNWDENQFAEWAETMTPIQRVEFQTAWMDAKSLYRKQQEELRNADTTYQEMQKKRQADAEAQQKQYFAQNEQLAKTVMTEFIKPETLKEYEDLGPAAEAILLKAARHELSAKDIFTQLAGNQVMARVIPKQDARIKELEATLAERDKKISEQDAFIANHAGAVPRGDAAGSSTPTGEKVALWNNLVVKTPGS